MRPVNGWIIVEKIEKPEKTAGGLYIPEEARQSGALKRCKVLKISQDVHDACKKEERDLPYKVGDIIVVHEKNGIDMNPFDKDDKRMFMNFEAVMGVE